MNKEHINRVKEFVAQQMQLGLKTKQIREKLIQELGIEYTDERIRQFMKEIRRQLDAINELNKLNYQSYTFEGDDIVFYKKTDVGTTQRIAVPVELARQIRYDFSRYGGNLSGEQVRKKYQITNEAYQLIKSRLGLYKDSDATPTRYLDYVKNKGGDTAKIIEETNYRAIRDKYRKTILDDYKRQLDSEYQRGITTLYNVENFLKYLQKYLKTHKPLGIQFNIKQPENNDTLHIIFGDIHLGKVGTQDILNRLNSMLNYILSQPHGNIIIICKGDIVETLIRNGMHNSQISYMDGPYGFDLLMFAVETLEKFLLEIYKNGKKIRFIGETGNHGRVEVSHEQDPERMGELIIYEMIKRGLQQTDIIIEYYKERWKTLIVDGINYISHHGDEGASNRKATEVLAEFGRSDLYNILIYGDKHHLEVQEINKKATKIIIPALAGQGEYDKKLGLSALPGYVVINKNEFNIPEIIVKRLP